MRHRHLLSTSQMFENDHDQSWTHMHGEQPYPNIGGAVSADNNSYFYPVENNSADGVHFASHWNSVPGSNGFTPPGHTVEQLNHQPDASGPSRDSLFHSSNPATFCPAEENYGHHASSSNCERQTWTDGGFDLTVGNGRGSHKRKSPGIPLVCDRGSSSRYYSAGSSSDLPVSSELQPDTRSIDSQHMPQDHISMNPAYRSNGLLIRSEGSTRNVRIRPAVDFESNLARTHLLNNPSHSSQSTSLHINHSSSVDLSGQSSGASTMEWSHVRMSPGQGRILVSEATSFSPETNHLLVGSNATYTCADGGGYYRDFFGNRNPTVAQSFPGTSSQSVRGVRSNYSQRSSPTFRASSSSLRLGHVAPSDEGPQLVGESYSSRHPRPLPAIAWRSGDRTGRSRILNERYRMFSDDAGVHNRFSSEGFMVVDRAALYGSRHTFDQHRDMRLDIDNMTYEELLSLGERIGNVNTGLSEDSILKGLSEVKYCSADQRLEEVSCAICLEEYKDMDDVGKLKACGHNYHVCCIKKWLSMKNSCPICKGSALPDDKKEKRISRLFGVSIIRS